MAKTKEIARKSMEKAATPAAPSGEAPPASPVAGETAGSIEPTQRHAFLIQHSQGESDFVRDGFRPYAAYRDLGLAKATNGMAQAHIIRMLPPCTDEVRKRHYHVTKLQYAYILRGWMKIEVEGEGPMIAKQGSFFMLPQSIKHTVLDYSDDCELMEVILPAQFETVNVPAAE